MGIKSGNIVASPAYIYQVVGCIEYLGRNPSKDTFYGDRTKIGKSVLDPSSGKWNARLIDFMVGLKLVEVEDNTKKIIVSPKVSEIYSYIQKMDQTDIDMFLVDTNSGNEVKGNNLLLLFERNIPNSNLYKKLKEVFLESYQYSYYCQYVYSHLFESMKKIQFDESFYSFVMTKLDNHGTPKSTAKSTKSSGATTAQNQMPSLLEWLRVFSFIKDENGDLYFMRDVKEIVKNSIEEGRDHIIFTGAPGTGKTYSVLQYMKQYACNRYSFIQFHSSFDYADFVEGLKPVVINGNRSFARMDGKFKHFCRNVVDKNFGSLMKAINVEPNKDQNLQVLENMIGRKDYHSVFNLLKTHDSDLTTDEIKQKEYLLHYLDDEIDGEKVIKDYFFCVDEINRADLSSVFGELLFALEKDYKGAEYMFDTQYYALPTYRLKNTGDAEIISKEEDCFYFGFFVPRNVRIIGTMNNIDRSVESIDFALRRRFEWIEVEANTVMEKSLLDMGLTVDLANKAKALNETISSSEVGLNKDYHIGPAYYKGAECGLETVYYKNILPVLREYVRGRDDEVVADFLMECEKTLLGDDNA